MGYRYEQTPPPKPENFLPVFDMYNNERRTWSIPCFYLEVEKPIDWHDYHLHDHLGWPDPHYPGHACQALPDYGPYAFSPGSVWNYVDMNKAIKIHLLSEYEGYQATYGSNDRLPVLIVFDEKDEQGNTIDTSDINVNGWIRADEDWIVDIEFDPTLDHFAGKPKEFLFNVYLQQYEETTTDQWELTRKDLLLRGKLVILPG